MFIKKLNFSCITIILSCLFYIIPITYAQIRPQTIITIEKGLINNTGILTDDQQKIYIEFLKNTAVSSGDKIRQYAGEILSPNIIKNPAQKNPAPRMREILSFRFEASTGHKLSFIDRNYLLPPKEQERRIQAQKNSNNKNNKKYSSGGVKFLTQIKKEDKIIDPELWQYVKIPKTITNNDKQIEKTRMKSSVFNNKTKRIWKRIGGKSEDSSDPNIKIFTAKISQTGVYVFFDAKPSPKPVRPESSHLINSVEASPMPSVIPLNPIEILNQQKDDLKEQSSSIIDELTDDIELEILTPEKANKLFIEIENKELIQAKKVIDKNPLLIEIPPETPELYFNLQNPNLKKKKQIDIEKNNSISFTENKIIEIVPPSEIIISKKTLPLPTNQQRIEKIPTGSILPKSGNPVSTEMDYTYKIPYGFYFGGGILLISIMLVLFRKKKH